MTAEVLPSAPMPRLRALLTEHAPALQGSDPDPVERALLHLERQLLAYDVTTLAGGELRSEWDAMIALYRAVRSGHATVQMALRSSDSIEELTRLYYRLRSIQGSLSMAYVVAGAAADRPQTSPVGTAIGLFDAPKVLAQETHLRSGSYDAMLPRFAEWILEIETDMEVRAADYVRFYGEGEVVEARAALRRILGRQENGVPQLYDVIPGGAHDPARGREQLRHWASDERDLLRAASTIQEVGHEARMLLVSLYAHRERYAAWLGSDAVDSTETALRALVEWPYPVGTTPLFDLTAEQDVLDALLAEVPDDITALRDPIAGWWSKIEGALNRASSIEQSLRDHADSYQDRYQDPRFRRSFRWYIWEFLALAQRAAPSEGLISHRPQPTNSEGRRTES